MVNTGLCDRTITVIKKYDDFRCVKGQHYLDKEHTRFSDAVMNKTKKEHFVEDFPALWKICIEMKNILMDFTSYVEMSKNSLSEKDSKIQDLQEKLLEFSDRNHNFHQVTTTQPDHTKHTLVIKPKTSSSVFDKSSWNTSLKTSFADKLKEIPVSKSTLTKDGTGIIMFPDADSMKKAEEAISKEPEMSQSYTIKADLKERAILYPKMKLLDINSTVYKKDDKDTLLKSILNKNSNINNLVKSENCVLEVIYIEEDQDTGYGSAIIKVDPKIRDLIIKNKRTVYLDMSSIHVKDQVHLIQCFACQKFSHKKGSKYCEIGEDNVCLYCAKNHRSKDCQSKRDPTKHKCSNCSKSKIQSIRSKAVGHTTTSKACPIVQREVETLVNRTAGLDPKNFLANRTMFQIKVG